MRRAVGFSLLGVAILLALAGGWWMQQQGILNIAALTGMAPGQAFLCINTPPSINFSCASSFNQSTLLIDNTLSCPLNATDVDGDSLVLGFESDAPGGWAYLSNGVVYLRPFQAQVGSHSVNVTATDDSGCANGLAKQLYEFTVLDINDPPVLVAPVEDVEFTSGRSVSPYSLYSFFDDPDGDSLSFSVFGANIVTVTIAQLSGNVMYSSDDCGTDYLFFRVADPFNLSADSGIVEVEVTCQEENEQSGGSSGGSGGSTFTCTPKWNCQEWSQCFPNGTQSRYCYDMNGCKYNDYERTFWRECEYVPTCFDGIQNNNETGVDCGGPCPPCGTCYDGLRNNDEEGVDCGGTVCEPCYNCTDGVQNWGETGVDCGGPICKPCPSCFDGIQNNNETGVDCGGPCPACAIGEVPAIIEEKSSLTTLLLLLLAVIITLLIIFKFYHRQLYAVAARLGWYFTRKRRKQLLLTDEQKKRLLQNLSILDHAMRQGTASTQAIMDKLTELSRLLFTEMFQLPFAFIVEDLAAAAKAKVHNDSLRRVFVSFFRKMTRYEQVASQHTHLECGVIIEEVRQLIFQTSNIVNEDLSQDASEKPLQGSPLEQCWQSLHNTFLALQFEDIPAAKKHYLKLLSLYESLGEQQKGLVAGDLGRCFLEIKYLLSWRT